MIPETIGQKHDIGRVAPVQCVSNDPLSKLKIRRKCFLLLIIRQGRASFRLGDKTFSAEAPCFVCFDEREDPTVVKSSDLQCDAVYFHPMFLNVNMTFERVHSNDFAQIATAHDLFLLKPFTDNTRFVFPLHPDICANLTALFHKLEDELGQQYDWYWSCRSRSYFIEMMLLLERTYGITTQQSSESANQIQNSSLKKAVLFIENSYHQSIQLEHIAQAASLNHATLTQLFKLELGMTPMAYLWFHRIMIAKKHLAFTNLPVKEVALRCGFKTVPHFCRKFEEDTGQTPSGFRETTLAARKAAF